jgi:hypothetical protein
MLAEWPAAAAWADAGAQSRLVAAWLRRKRIEARLIAAEVGRLFAGAGDDHQRVSESDMLAMLGVTVRGLDGSQIS